MLILATTVEQHEDKDLGNQPWGAACYAESIVPVTVLEAAKCDPRTPGM